jgi:hypothetical protein
MIALQPKELCIDFSTLQALPVLPYSINYLFLAIARLPFAAALLLAYMICIRVGYSLQHTVTSHAYSFPRYLILQTGGVTFVYFVTI